MPLALLNVMLHFFFLQQWKFSNVCHTIGMKKIHSSLPQLQVPDGEFHPATERPPSQIPEEVGESDDKAA